MSIGKIPTLRRYHNYPHSSARREEWNALPQIPSHDRKEDEKKENCADGRTGSHGMKYRRTYQLQR